MIKSLSVKLTSEEMSCITNALNDVCNGDHIEDWEFHTRMGQSREFARDLLGKLLNDAGLVAEAAQQQAPARQTGNVPAADFQSLDGQFRVIRSKDKFVCEPPTFAGCTVDSALPIDDGNRCVLLLSYECHDGNRFENLFCIDRKLETVWVARLPETDDCFVYLSGNADGIRATSWSGFGLRIDPSTGATIDQVFVK